MTATDLGALRALLEAATPRPWRYTDSEAVNDVWEGGMTVVSSDGDPIANVCDEWYEGDPGEPAPMNDAALIAAAVNALPDLLATAEAHERILADLATVTAERDAAVATVERVRAMCFGDYANSKHVSGWAVVRVNDVLHELNTPTAALEPAPTTTDEGSGR